MGLVGSATDLQSIERLDSDPFLGLVNVLRDRFGRILEEALLKEHCGLHEFLVDATRGDLFGHLSRLAFLHRSLDFNFHFLGDSVLREVVLVEVFRLERDDLHAKVSTDLVVL